MASGWWVLLVAGRGMGVNTFPPATNPPLRAYCATGERLPSGFFRARPAQTDPTDSPQRTAPKRQNARVPLFNPPEAGNSFLTYATHYRGVGRGFAIGRGLGMGVPLGIGP